MLPSDLDLPLETTPASRFLLWITAALIFLAVLAFAMAVVADARLRDLERQPHIVTLALPPDPSGTAAAPPQAMLEALEDLPGAVHAELVPEAELDGLLRSGDAGAMQEPPLAMPRLIDITFHAGGMPDPATLRARINEIAPEASIGESGALEHSRHDTARRLRAIGLTVGGAVLLLVVAATVAVTRTSLALHAETVDLLRQMGATDGYVARQFEHHALINGVKGALIGFVCALLFVLGLYVVADLGAAEAGSGLRPRPFDWILLALVPVVAALLLTIAARLTAIRGLTRRP